MKFHMVQDTLIDHPEMKWAVDNIPVMIAYWDKNEVCRYANKAYLDWFGKTQVEMINKMTLSDLLGNLYEKNQLFISGVLAGTPQSFEREITTPTGEVRSTLANYYPDIQAGEVKGFAVHVTDISGIKRLEKELVSSEIKFRALVENAPDAIVVVNDKGLIQLTNSQAERLFGYKKNEMYLKPVETLLPEHFRARHKTHHAGFHTHPIARPMGTGVELFALHKSGHQIPVEISLTPIELEGTLQVNATIRDISERKETERKLIESRTNLESLAKTLQFQNTKLADFAYIASHNLRAPAGNLRMLLQMYSKPENEADKAQLFSMFETVVGHLNHTLDTLVKALKVNMAAEWQPERIYFEEVVNKTEALLSGDIAKTRARIEKDFSRAPSIEYNRN